MVSNTHLTKNEHMYEKKLKLTLYANVVRKYAYIPIYYIQF